MPIYEYRCRACGRKNSFLVLNLASPPPLVCRSCRGTDLEKLISRVAILRSEDERLEDLADSAERSGLDEKDPRSAARWIKKMGREMGEDVGEDLDQSLEETAERGESGEQGSGEEESGSSEID